MFLKDDMREFLFRGKNIYSNYWEFGSIVYDKIKNEYTMKVPTNVELMYGIKPETIGQYTGQKDFRNKIKIFEDDKVVMSLSEIGCGVPEGFEGVVKIIEGQWIVSKLDKNKHRYQWYPLFQNFGWWKITGNIHDK